MKRIFFNGVSKFSYDGQFVSFSLDDTKPDPQFGTANDIVFTGICDLRALEGIVEFLNTQIQEVKKRDTDSAQKSSSPKKQDIIDEKQTLMVLKATEMESHN